MKKKLCLTAIMSMMLAVLGGCGNSEINPDKYVTLGDYKNLSVEADYMTYTDEDVTECAEEELAYYVDAYGLYETVSENTVKNGSIVNIDYEGKIDGVAFDGGTSTGAHLEIGSGSFIEGFEDGLIGMKVGENVDLNLTFPENYGAEDYAGKDVVFSVSVNSIEKMPEYTDELITSLGIGEDITTYQDFEDYIRDYLQDTCDSQNASALENAVWEAVYNSCEVSDPPQEMVDQLYEEIVSYYESYASYYGTDLESLVTDQLSMDMDTFEERSREAATEEAKGKLVYMAIAKAEGIKVTEDMINEAAENEYETYGYESAEAFIEGTGEEEFEYYVLRTKVEEYLEEVVSVTRNEVSVMDILQ
jgi:trigger factor